MGANAGVRSVDRVTSSKYYWEITFTTSAHAATGILYGAGSFGTYGLNGGGGVLCTGSGGQLYGGPILAGNSLGISLGGTIADGWICCIALDVDNSLIWLRNGASGNWNGNATYAPGGLGGVNLASLIGIHGPAFGIYAAGSSGGTTGGGLLTANFGGSAFTGAVPSGYTSGFPSGTTLVNADVVTQVAIEQWASITRPQMQVTQVAVEEWASVGSVGTASKRQSSVVTAIGLVAIGETGNVQRSALPGLTLEESYSPISIGAGVGNADGQASVAGASPPPTGHADGFASVSGVGYGFFPGQTSGAADGSADVEGSGAFNAPAAGAADGQASASAVSFILPAGATTGTATAYATVAGAGAALVAAHGYADGQASVDGKGLRLLAPVGFPMLPGIGWPVHRRPNWRTVIVPHVSGAEVRTPLWPYPLWEFELTIDGVTASATQFKQLGANSFQTLLGFYLNMAGQLGTFLFYDSDFNYQAGAQVGTGDGSTTTFPFMRQAGGAWWEPISWTAGTPSVYLNGVKQTSGYSLLRPNLLSFAAPPAIGAAITADVSYYFLCRFLDDGEDFQQQLINLWDMKSIKFRQIRQIPSAT
jgi:hypothetical protein